MSKQQSIQFTPFAFEGIPLGATVTWRRPSLGEVQTGQVWKKVEKFYLKSKFVDGKIVWDQRPKKVLHIVIPKGEHAWAERTTLTRLSEIIKVES